MRFLSTFILLFGVLYSYTLHFKKYELKGSKKGDTLLVIGGIHGNEPGGYFSASILIEHYKIIKGNLFVVPNLNFDSDIRNKRGIYGDMNRKFAKISKKDPDYEIIKEIKKIILSKDIDLILNLHDGHGFYRKRWENAIFNPKAWGQAFIIDQNAIKTYKYYNLGKLCKKVSTNINNNIFKKKHLFGIKNTKTKFYDEQMRLSLTYFAITHAKAALAIETSKNITDLTKKVYYQLLAIEEFMKNMGIQFRRDFDLNEKDLKKILAIYGKLSINSRTNIDLSRVKKNLNFWPLKPKENSFVFTHPLGSIIKVKKYYKIMVGNKNIAIIKPQYFQFSSKKPKIFLKTEGKTIDISKKFEIKVDSSFSINVSNNIRVNVIGFTDKYHKNEANIIIDPKKIDKKYSIYKNSNVFRVEFYDDENRYIKTILLKTNNSQDIK